MPNDPADRTDSASTGAIGRTKPGRSGVLVVDDYPLFREGVRGWLERQTDLRYSGEAADTETARKAIRESNPEVVLLSVSVGGEEPGSLVKRMRRDFPGIRIVVLIRKDEVMAGEAALRAGAHGLMTKDQGPDDLRQAVNTVLQGEIYLNKDLTALMLKKAYFGDRTDQVASHLSNRELQVFGLLGQGYGTREIATRLNLSRRTVNVHRENIKHKLGLKAASSLVYSAITWMQNQGNPVPAELAR